MNKWLLFLTIGTGLAVSGCTFPEEESAPAVRPRGAAPLEVTIPHNAIYLFDHAQYGGHVTRLENVTQASPEVMHDVPRDNMITSIRWDLPPGVVAVLYQHAEGQGNELAFWGNGEVPSVSPWKINDKVSRWAWYYIGGPATATAANPYQLSLRPPAAQATTLSAPNTIELYNDRDFGGHLTSISVNDHTPGAIHKVGLSANDHVTSLRWNLPPGVIVILYEDALGRGRQLPIWGTGQYASVSPMNLNDKITDWAWYDLARGHQRATVEYPAD